jgi:lysophospholipase L1-like esterase
MRRELSRLRSNATIKVINSGRIGDTIPNNIARFERDVFAHTPDLVIWQLGTNDVAWGGRPDQGLKRSVLEGVRALKAGSSDVVLMDLQYAPQVLASASYPTMEGIIIDVAKQERVGLFSRFALMRNSINAGVAQSALVTFDGLHNTADGYDCIGRALAPSHLNECALTGVARPNRKLRLRMSWALAAKRADARERQQDQILLDDHRDSRSQWVTAIRADAVRRCAHEPLRQRTY